MKVVGNNKGFRVEYCDLGRIRYSITYKTKEKAERHLRHKIKARIKVLRYYQWTRSLGFRKKQTCIGESHV